MTLWLILYQIIKVHQSPPDTDSMKLNGILIDPLLFLTNLNDLKMHIQIFHICHRIARIVICDLYLLFEGKKLKMLISLKWRELALKCVEVM